MARHLTAQGLTLEYRREGEPSYRNKKAFNAVQLDVSDERLLQLAEGYGVFYRADILAQVTLTGKQIVDFE